MAGYNRIILMGNITRDPLLKFTQQQTAIVEFGLATNRKWTGQDGQEHDETCFVDCVLFGKRAEAFNKYLSKGSPVLIEGRLAFETWQAQDGSKRSKHKVVVENFSFAGQAQSDQGDDPPF